MQLEALRERRPPWPSQIITLIWPTVKMLSLVVKDYRPPPPPPFKRKKTYFWIITCTYHYYGSFWSFVHLKYPDHHQNLISFSLYYPGPLHKISFQSVHTFWSNVHRQTNKQTNQRYQKHNLLANGGNDTY